MTVVLVLRAPLPRPALRQNVIHRRELFLATGPDTRHARLSVVPLETLLPLDSVPCPCANAALGIPEVQTLLPYLSTVPISFTLAFTSVPHSDESIGTLLLSSLFGVGGGWVGSTQPSRSPRSFNEGALVSILVHFIFCGRGFAGFVGV